MFGTAIRGFCFKTASKDDEKILEQRVQKIDMIHRPIDIDAEQLTPLMAAAFKDEEIRKTAAVYPMRISVYYAGLIKAKADPIWQQAVADPAELNSFGDNPDPLCEETQSPVPCIIHRYPDRVVFIVSNRCAVYCRHCMRKRKVGETVAIGSDSIEKGITYIQNNSSISDVILSGGDPLMLPTSALMAMLEQLQGIKHLVATAHIGMSIRMASSRPPAAG